RQELSTGFRQRYTSFPRHVLNIVSSIPLAIGLARDAFNLRLFIGEACALSISFAGSPPLSLVLAVAVGLTVLILREPYIPADEGCEREAATVSMVATFIVLSQVLMEFAAPSLTMPGVTLARGVALSILLLSMWRLAFQMKRSKPDG